MQTLSSRGENRSGEHDLRTKVRIVIPISARCESAHTFLVAAAATTHPFLNGDFIAATK